LFRLLLISPNRTQTHEQIIEAFWREKTPSSAKALLHQATSSLRHLLEPKLPGKFPSRYVLVEGGRVTLQLPPGSWVDFEAFEFHYDRRQWAEAFALYRGDLFPDDRYEDWAVLPRERWRQMAIQVMIHVAREMLAAGQFDRAIDACQRALALEPWQEEAVLLGMKAYIAQNNRAGAIRLYLALTQRLRDELGIAPQKMLQDLYQTLLE
jgi:DNA-binding SARP family transcriptional activator